MTEPDLDAPGKAASAGAAADPAGRPAGSDHIMIINCKNYMEVSGNKIDGLVEAAEEASRRRNVRIAVAPPQHLLARVAGAKLTVLAQLVDDADIGGTTGYVVPEMLKESGVDGSIINHSEHRIPEQETARLVARLRRLGMISVVCARDSAEVERLSATGPDYVAIEPPELIGSGRAVSKERPALIEESAAAAASSGSGTRLLCGAGIISGGDVRRAIQLGAAGILVASGIVKGEWNGIIDEFARAASERAQPGPAGGDAKSVEELV